MTQKLASFLAVLVLRLPLDGPLEDSNVWRVFQLPVDGHDAGLVGQEIEQLMGWKPILYLRAIPEELDAASAEDCMDEKCVRPPEWDPVFSSFFFPCAWSLNWKSRSPHVVQNGGAPQLLQDRGD